MDPSTEVPAPADRVRIGHTSPQQAGDVAGMLARAFAHDRVYEALLPTHGQRVRTLDRLFRLGVRDAGRHGAVDVATADGDVVGAAVWLAPGSFPLTVARKVRSLPGLLRLALCARGHLPALVALGTEVEALHDRTPTWYLQAMGVDPSWQASGIGSRLLSHGLQRADRDRVDAALETSSPAAAHLYERAGFTTARAGIQLVAGAPPHQLMRRVPAPL